MKQREQITEHVSLGERRINVPTFSHEPPRREAQATSPLHKCKKGQIRGEEMEMKDGSKHESGGTLETSHLPEQPGSQQRTNLVRSHGNQ